MEVEVVAPEVEEGGDVEDHAVHPAEDEGVAGDLHRAGVHAVLAHDPEEPVQVRRLGGGELGLHVVPGDTGADGADHGRRHAGRGEALLEDPRGGGLALRAGDADDAQAARRVAVDAGRQAPQHVTGVGHDDRRRARRQQVEPCGVGQHRDRSRVERLAGEGRTVRTRAREGGVQVTGTDPGRAERDAGDVRAQVAVEVHVGQGREPRRELRGGRRRGQKGSGGTRRLGRLVDWMVHRGSVSTHHSTGRRDGFPPVGSTP